MQYLYVLQVVVRVRTDAVYCTRFKAGISFKLVILTAQQAELAAQMAE